MTSHLILTLLRFLRVGLSDSIFITYHGCLGSISKASFFIILKLQALLEDDLTYVTVNFENRQNYCPDGGLNLFF